MGDVATYDLAPYYHGGNFYQYTPATSSEHGQYVGGNVVAGKWRVNEDGASGTKITLVTRTSGVGNEDKVSIDQAGNVDILKSGGVLKIVGTQVLAAQGAAVADATDAASAITQLNALLARCRAHGLIAT